MLRADRRARRRGGLGPSPPRTRRRARSGSRSAGKRPADRLRPRGRRRGARRDLPLAHPQSAPYPSQTDINFATGLAGMAVADRRAGRRRARGALLCDRGSGEVEEVEVVVTPIRAARLPVAARTTHSLDERFCPTCGMPLVYAGPTRCRPADHRAPRARPQGQAAVRRGRARARGRRAQPGRGGVHPGPAARGGRPERCCSARAGFDVPDMLAAGPRDVMVPASGAPTAREVLLAGRARQRHPRRVADAARAGARRPARARSPSWRSIAWLGTD